MSNTYDETNHALVLERIQNLEENFSLKVQAVREVILQAYPSIKEKIEWNFPCFYVGETVAPSGLTDRENVLIEMNLRHNKIILVFPTGTKVKGVTGIYEGSYKDGRRIVPITTLEDLAEKTTALTSVIQQWIKATEK